MRKGTSMKASGSVWRLRGVLVQLLQVALIILVAWPVLDARVLDARIPGARLHLDRATEVGTTPADLPDVPDWSVEGDLSHDKFASSMDGAGDVNGDGYADVIIGAPQFPAGAAKGKAYAFHGSPSGLTTTPGWTAAGEADFHNFGGAVAGAGDVNGDGYADVVVGAQFAAEGNGRIYIYAGSPGGLSPTPSWTAEGAAYGDDFGSSVSGAGDVNGDGYADILVGAPGAGDNEEGQAYLFFGSPDGIGATAWSATGEQAYGDFGDAVSGAGDVNGDGYADIAVGQRSYGTYLLGAAYVYLGSASGPSETADWTEYGESDYDYFGRTLAAAGDVNGDGYADLAIGSRNYGGNVEGKVFVYAGSPVGLEATALWSTTGVANGDVFGISIGGAGDVDGDGYGDLVVGAPGNGEDRGRVYLYHGSSEGLSTAWHIAGENDDDQFGTTVAGAGDANGDGYADIISGAPCYLGGLERGKAYGYYGGGDPLSFFDEWSQPGQNMVDLFGYSVAPAGDVNGDGYGDVIVGATGYPNDGWQGRAYVYHGSEAGLKLNPDWMATGEQQLDFFGCSVAAAGDVNGDGYADVIVGADGYPSDDQRGKVYVYHGGATGLGTSPAWVTEGELDYDRFGRVVAGAGDLNGDGYADIVVSAPRYPGSSGDNGKVYTYYGSPTGLGTGADWTATGESGSDRLGGSLSGAGDVNGDGYSDLVVGSAGYGSSRGKVCVYHGGPSGPGSAPDWTALGENADDGFGYRVAGVGDVNGDGFGDIAVARASWYALTGPGKVYVFHGSPAGPSITADWTRIEYHDGDYFGSAVTGAGDVNGDGFADLIVGAELYRSGSGKGAAYLYHGSATGLANDEEWAGVGENLDDRYGASVAVAGDVNGDSYSDVIVGAYAYPGGGLRGKVYVYFGNRDQGRSVLAQQLLGDGSGTTVQPWGLSHKGNRFAVGMWATHPSGRGRVKLEVEACPAGEALGGMACTRYISPTWVDVTASEDGVQFMETVSGLLADTLYRWRARVLYAPLTVTEPGITPPPNPAHGPWRRFQGQAIEADVRTIRAWEIYLPVVVESR
jgi:hypothetical protein